jgi:hypothetical protein
MKQKLPAPQIAARRHVPAGSGGLLAEVREMILQARAGVARAVDSGLVTLYWHVGRRIRQDILKEKRAEYGEQIVSALGRQLSSEFGRGFSDKSLRHMIRLAEVFPDLQIVSALLRQLTWTHFLSLIYLDDPLKRDFYAEMCRIENWNTRTLARKIGGMLFERTALSRKPAKLAELELKQLREFQAGDKGQMELYLRWLDKYEKKPGEETPIGLILCAGQKHETVELLELEQSNIRVASYWLKLLPRKLLQRKLHQAVLLARERLARKQLEP